MTALADIKPVEQVLPAAPRGLPVPWWAKIAATRPENSSSKLRTYRDGARILLTILRMYRALHPLRFFGSIVILLVVCAVILGEPLIVTYLETGLVPRFPTAILVMGLMQLAVMSAAVGLILQELASSRREQKLMRFLDIPSPAARHER